MNNHSRRDFASLIRSTFFILSLAATARIFAADPVAASYPIGLAYAATAVNADVFRVSSLASAGGFQFVTYYAPDGAVVVGRRTIGQDKWDQAIQNFKANIHDAHNDVVLGISSDGFVHLSYDHHGAPLHYRVSQKPYDIRSFSAPKPMTGQTESRVTYPQFISAPDGTIHLAWCWRDTGNAATNHDLCYVQSRDHGKTWLRSDARPQPLPITQENAEVVLPIHTGSNLINQCSSAVDANGHPHLAQYFNDKNGIPQYFDVWFDGQTWHTTQVSQRKTKFSLRGGGSLAIPVSRPEIGFAPGGQGFIIVRDAEMGGGIVLYRSDASFEHWHPFELSHQNLGNWEPTYDQTRLRTDGILSLFVLPVEQGNHERTTDFPPQQAYVLELPLK